MGLGSALSTAVSGLNVNQSAIDVIGNNLANTNTTAFKSFRSEFANNFYQTVNIGSAPTGDNGGLNPRQVGLGANLSSIGVDFRPGTPTATGIASDLFIQGAGFFTVRRSNEVLYTRDGSFRLNSQNELVTARGELVQGFGVDENFNLQAGTLSDIDIPLGQLTVAQQTQTAFLQGSLRASGDVANQPTVLGTQPGSIPLGAGAATALNTISVGVPPRLLINEGPANTFNNPVLVTYTPQKSNRSLEPASFVLNPTDTIGTFMNNVMNSLGISTTTGQTTPAGVSFATANEIRITGNLGTVNDFSISPGDFTITGLGPDGQFGSVDDTVGSIASAFNFNNPLQRANGESISNEFVAYDSLGAPVRVGLSAYLESASDDQTVFRVMFESRDNDVLPSSGQLPPGARGPASVISNAQMVFDKDGRLIDPPNLELPISIDRSNAAPQNLDFDINVGGVTALAVPTSNLAIVSQDGSPPGTLTDFNIDTTGIINGTFDNGITRRLGQVQLARFINPAGLVGLENNLYRQGPNSGLAFTTAPGTNGTGTIIAGSLELSNVDIATSFVQLLQASTFFSANTRVISTTQELFQTLLALPRT